ncbi:MAG: hypothetical protein WCK05_10440 [Planctomycetota bacterium]
MNQLRITRSRTPAVLLLLSLAGGGVAAAHFARHDAVSGNPDAIVYVEAADNLLRGNGLTAIERHYTGSPLHRFRDEPLTHYPPLFPLLIAGVSACGVASVEAAQWLNMLLMAASILLAGHVAYRASAGALGAAFVAGALVLASPTTFRMHTEALSEPLFVFLAVGGMALLADYLDTQKLALLAAAAVLVALAWLARYVGVAMWGTAVIALLLRSGAPLRRRLAEASLFSAMAATPMLGWLIHNRLVAGTAAHRPIAFHPLPAREWQAGLKAVRHWFIPHDAPRALTIVTLCVIGITILAVGVVLWRRKRRPGMEGPLRVPRLVRIMGLFAAVYLGVMVVSMTFVDALTPFNFRTLYPLYVCAVVAGCVMVASIYRVCGRKERLLIAGSACALLVTGVSATACWVLESRREGLGATRSWMHSETMRKVAALPPDTSIYTNAGMGVHFQTGRRAFGVPVKFDPISGTPNSRYEWEMRCLREGLKKPGSVLVLFPGFWLKYTADTGELRRAVDLETVFQDARGAILQSRRP